MHAQALEREFEAGLTYDAYVRTGSAEQQRRWAQVYEVAHLSDSQKSLTASFTRQMNILVVSGIWCGDCVQQCPLMARIAEANPSHLNLKFVDRDLHKQLSEQVRINDGSRVPIAIFMSEDYFVCGIYGDRTLSRYRAVAMRQLGAACEIAIAPPARDELTETLNEWLGEFERIQLMLRISPRLREKHGD